MNEQVREMGVGVDAEADAVHVSKMSVYNFISMLYCRRSLQFVALCVGF